MMGLFNHWYDDGEVRYTHKSVGALSIFPGPSFCLLHRGRVFEKVSKKVDILAMPENSKLGGITEYSVQQRGGTHGWDMQVSRWHRIRREAGGHRRTGVKGVGYVDIWS